MSRFTKKPSPQRERIKAIFPFILLVFLAGASVNTEALKPNLNNNNNSPPLAFKLSTRVNDNNRHELYKLNHKHIIHEQEIQSIIYSIRGGDVEEDTEKPIAIKAISIVGNTILGTIFAFKRAIEAGIDAVQDESLSPVGKIFNMMTCMVKAAFDKDYETKGKASYSKSDFAGYLCKAYGVSTPDDDKDSVKIRGGSLSDALRKARSQARLLVVFIPSSKPKKQKSDQKAIESLVSPNVHEVAERKARKNEEGGSFVFWSAKYDSSDAASAIKRLKAKKGSGNGKNPVLMVVYPSASMDSSGQVKVVPRVLAQHHCNPPPLAEPMSSWLNALRKRHAKQYGNMQHELKELELFKERTQGYKSSMKENKERENEEKIMEKKRLEEEKAKKEREEEMKQRRASLLEALPEEPERGGEGVITIALRFSDGRKGQRLFDGETEMVEVFNWIDAMYEIERELVVLTTMNGQRSFSYGKEDGLTLEDAGFGKMAALRVTEQKIEEEDDADGSDEEDGSDGEE